MQEGDGCGSCCTVPSGAQGESLCVHSLHLPVWNPSAMPKINAPTSVGSPLRRPRAATCQHLSVPVCSCLQAAALMSW